MNSDQSNIEVFNRDASARGGYVYTATTRLSCHLATERSLDAILETGRFAGRSVVDMGCGDGYYTIRLWDKSQPRALTGVDAAAAAIEIASQHKEERPIQFAVGDAHKLPFPDNSFDLALVQSILHHDDNPADIIREAFRLAPVILIHEPNGNNFGLKIIEKTSRYHREHGEKSYSSRQISRWIRQAGGEIQWRRFAGFVPMFCPDWLAKTMKAMEPFLEGTPGLRALGCAVFVAVASPKMKRVALTGATGFVGANLARRLLRDGHEVHLLVRPGYNPWRIDAIRADVRTHELRLDDAGNVERVIGQIRPEWIFHLAVHGAYSSQTDLQQMLLTNIHGTMNLVTACLKAGFEAFVNTGSSSEYGFKDHPATETELLEPNSHYAVTKASATLFCRQMAQREQAPLTTLRLYSVYGPYEEPSRLMPTLILRGLRREWPPLVNPDTARDYVHVDDVGEAYFLAAQSPSKEWGAIYNVGTGRQTTLREVVEVAQRELAVPSEPKWGSMPSRQWDTNCWVADSRLIREKLAWRPQFSFEEGFRQMLEWFGANPDLRAFYERVR